MAARRATGPAAVSVRDLSWGTLGIAEHARASSPQDDGIETPTDLAELVRAVSEATAALGIAAQPSPWLAALPESVLLEDVDPETGPPVRGQIPPLTLGTADLPVAAAAGAGDVGPRSGAATWASSGRHAPGRSSALRLLGADIARRRRRPTTSTSTASTAATVRSCRSSRSRTRVPW